MTIRAGAAMLALAAIWTCGSAAPTLAQLPTPAQTQSQIYVSPFADPYLPTTDPKLSPIRDKLKQLHVLEELQAFLKPLHLPKQLQLVTNQCGGAQRQPYAAGQPVTICYEMVEQLLERAPKIYPQNLQYQNDTVTGGFIEAALHETALGIFSILQIPIWGRIEDAADRVSALIMVELGEDVEDAAMDATIDLFSNSDEKTWTGSEFASADSPDAQRFFNFVCIAAAADPGRYGNHLAKYDGDKTSGVIVPWSRSKNCMDLVAQYDSNSADCTSDYDKCYKAVRTLTEFDQIRQAFDLAVMPYVDQDALIGVRATDRLHWTPGEMSITMNAIVCGSRRCRLVDGDPDRAVGGADVTLTPGFSNPKIAFWNYKDDGPYWNATDTGGAMDPSGRTSGPG